jgi:hypothetical protein
MQMTVKDVATQVLRELNVIDYTDTAPDNAHLIYVLTRIVLMLDLWEADRLTVQATERKVFPLIANQASYTLGPGGDWDAYRPEFIADAGFINTFVNPTDPLETPVTIYTDETWRAIALKTLTSTIVWGIWQERTNTAGRSKVFVHPIITNTGQIALYYPIPWSNVALSEAGLNTTMTLPPAYFNAILYNAAVDSAEGFEKVPSPMLIRKADRALTILKRANKEPMISRLPKRLMRRVRRGYNILVNQ